MTLSPSVAGDLVLQTAQLLFHNGILLSEAERQFKKNFIEHALRECHGNQLHTALRIGTHRNTLSRWIADLKIDCSLMRAPGRYRRDPANYASKERPARGVKAAASSALAPVRSAQGQCGAESNLFDSANSVRKGGRGESPEPLRGGELRSSGTSKLPRGEFPFDLDVECGGLKA